MPHQEFHHKESQKIGDLSFEEALAELERIVRTLDAGQSSLEASLRDYENGIQLLRHCHATLQNAERRIEILKSVNSDGDFVTEIAPESQFLTDTAQPGQRKSDPLRKKRVRKTLRDDDSDEPNDMPFDFE